MQTKYSIPKDIRESVVWIIRGQKRREKEYAQKKKEILAGKDIKHINNKNLTEINSELLSLEENQETVRMKIVEQSLNEIGSDILNRELREKLKQGIIMNIENRNECPYRNLNIPNVSEKSFYKYKNKFIYDVAKKLKFI